MKKNFTKSQWREANEAKYDILLLLLSVYCWHDFVSIFKSGGIWYKQYFKQDLSFSAWSSWDIGSNPPTAPHRIKPDLSFISYLLSMILSSFQLFLFEQEERGLKRGRAHWGSSVGGLTYLAQALLSMFHNLPGWEHCSVNCRAPGSSVVFFPARLCLHSCGISRAPRRHLQITSFGAISQEATSLLSRSIQTSNKRNLK